MLTVFNIQRYSIHDGKGVRTNIFFKGCPLNCTWCNNPEGIDPAPSIMYDARLCHRFGDCIKAADGSVTVENNKLIIRRDLIRDPSSLRDICPSKALIVTGQEKSIPEIIQEIEKDMPFYSKSEGGVTFTGGEPLFQGPELFELVSELKKRGIHMAVETALHVAWDVIETYVNLIDVFLVDLKHTDSAKFTKFTGGDCSLVLKNFKKLDESGRKFVVRVPVIPGFNFSQPEQYAIIDFASGLKNATEIDFIPYHSLAREKYLMLGKEYLFGNHRNIEHSELRPFTEYAEQKGLMSEILN